MTRDELLLGVVLAGGEAARFGSDKALAEIDGHTLLARAVDLLAGWCDHVVVAGRPEAPAPTLPDWPHAGLGPLGGLAAALHFAQDEGYAAVLSLGVDALGLPEDLPARLAPGPAWVKTQPAIGLWPVAVSPALDALLHDETPPEMAAVAERLGARAVELPGVVLVATLEDLPGQKK